MSLLNTKHGQPDSIFSEPSFKQKFVTESYHMKSLDLNVPNYKLKLTAKSCREYASNTLHSLQTSRSKLQWKRGRNPVSTSENKQTKKQNSNLLQKILYLIYLNEFTFCVLHSSEQIRTNLLSFKTLIFLKETKKPCNRPIPSLISTL